MEKLSMSIQYIKGVGPKSANRLKILNIYTVLDMLYYIPKEYEDRSKITTLNNASINEKITLEIEIIGAASIIRPRNNMSILKVPFKDETARGSLVWFNQDYLKNKFPIGEKFRVNGKLNRMGNELQLVNPVYEKLGKSSKTGRILPIYGLTEGITNNYMIKIIQRILKENLQELKDPLPIYLREKYKLLKLEDSIRNIHFPEDISLQKRAKSRLIFEELLILQLGLFIIKNKNFQENQGIIFPQVAQVNDFIDALPFKLTNAQVNVIKEIEEDMGTNKQMNRLVQGDVGSGKTIVGAIAMYRAVKSGYQAAMMAPTEILATQHFESLIDVFNGHNINCALLVGSLTKKEKEKVLEDLKDGTIDIIIGTHAIIQENVEFHKLGLAITDEQHRFGVRQRAILSEKGSNPDILVMTATPIPRTLALILYGDLDISIIDELPPGRREIETFAIGFNILDRLHKFIEKQILAGRQAYIVSPLIEESETMDLNSAEELYKELSSIFNQFNVGLLHGKMKSKDKDLIMEEFKAGDIDILVSTTVIEVGVNVPNASLMVIYNAERFGLAQLHQLRGRVGRGEYQSYCILVNNSKSQIARERMRVLQNSSDGFQISEKDLELRGPGEFFGTKQHGLPELRIANLARDLNILKYAQKEALNIMEKDPYLEDKEHENLKLQINHMFKSIGDEKILN